MRLLSAARTGVDSRDWSVVDAILNLARAWRRRRRFAGLRELDDRLLRDIGLTRDDIRWGLSLPLSEDATLAVKRHLAAGPAEPQKAVNSVCPWTGRPVSSAATTLYRGHVVGFGSADALHEFERARSMFDAAIAGRDER